MSVEALSSDYPVVGAHIGALLMDNPDAVSRTITELARNPAPLDRYPIDNRPLCEDYAAWATSFFCESGSPEKDRETYLRGMILSAMIADHTDSGRFTLLSDECDEVPRSKIERYEAVYGYAHLAKSNFRVIQEVIDEGRHIVDPAYEARFYTESGMASGFMMVDFGSRKVQRRIEAVKALHAQFDAVVAPIKDVFADIDRGMI